MSIRSFFGFGKGRKSQSQSSKRTLRMEALEERALLSAAPLSTSEYADLCDQYAEFNLPANMNDLNVITLDLAQGDGLSQLKSAITTAGTTTKSDLIVVRTSDTANTLIYTAAGNELLIDIDSSQYGSITIIGWGEEKFTLDANQKSRVMSISDSTVVNLGSLTITGGNSTGGNSTVSNVEEYFGGGIYNHSGTLTITNCEISGNTAYRGGGIFNDGTTTITNSTIAKNTAADFGGGIYIFSGTLTGTNITISGNTAADCGGGICKSFDGVLTITNSIVSRNYNGNIYGDISTNSSNNLIGGYYPCFVNPPQFNSIGKLINADTMDLHLRSDSIAIDKGDNTAVVDIESDLDGNARIFGESVDIGAYEYQGDRDDKPIPYFSVVNTLNDSFDLNDNEWSLREAIYYATEYVTITFADKLEGTIVLTRGGLQIEAPLAIDGDNRITLDGNQQCRVFNVSAGTEESSVVFNGLTIQNGNAESGGGICNSGTLTVTNCEISGNTGSGICNGGTLTVTNCEISGNTTDYSGGGICNEGTLTVTNSEILGNTADYGGGICNEGTLTVTNSMISGNSARYGGGIYNIYETLTVTNSTISGNTASSEGGGIFNNYGTLTVTNSTISGNTADHGGGIYHNNHKVFPTTANIYNTIVACNTASSDKDIYCEQYGFVYGYNCLSSYTEWDNGNNNIVYNSNKQLFIDATNGDYHLAIGSQAIDKGNNAYAVDANDAALVYDLDNRSRIVYGVVDIGAYEYHAPLATPTLSVEATGSDSISVTVGSVANASGYTVEYSTSADFANASSRNVSAGVTTITGLTAETTYYFRVMALGTGDYSNSDYSETASATTLAEPVTADAVVNARIVFQDSLTTVDTSADLPEGISSIRAGKTVYADIWLKDVEDTDPAIIGAYMNMLYDSEALTVQNVTYGTVFTQFNNFQDVSVPGVIDLIGGGVTQGVMNKGDDEWIRLATVSFVVDTEGDTTVSLTPPTDYHDNVTLVGGVILTNDQIDFGSAVLEVSAACPMDIDGDGYIGLSDYSLLSAAWRSSPGKDNWNPACDIDGDGYVGLSDYSFLSSNWRKYATDPDLVYPGANASPAALVSDFVLGVLDQPALEPESSVVSLAAAAVSEENSGDLDNPIALEADETAKICLTAVSSKTASDVAADVPASLTEINPGDSFFVEIWVRNVNGYQGSNLCGLLGGYLNMSYPSDLLTVGDVTYGSVFTLFNNYQNASVPGVIDLIGGAVAQGVKDKGDDEWVRLATVAFTASEKGDALIESLPPTDSHDNLTLTSSVTLQNDEIDYGSLTLSIGSVVIQLTVQNDFVKTTLNNPVVIDYRENDTVSDWSETTVQFGDASYGEYAVNEDGTISYTPDEGFYGTDAVSYVVVGSSGELATGAIVINVGLPIAASVQTTSGSHSPSSAMAPSVPSVTDWDDCYVELWAQGVNELNPGETTLTLEYNPAVYDAPTFSACADGVALTVSQSSVLPNGNVQVELTAQVSEPLASQTDNLFLGTVVLTPSMDEGSGVDGAAVPVIGLDGSESQTTVESMPYDLIRNGAVDVNDFIAFATVYGYVPENVSPDNPLYSQTAKADFNNDGIVNVDDFIMFAINYGATRKTADMPAAQGALQVQSEELVIQTAESDNSQFETSSVQLINDSRVESVQTLRQAHSSALLDLYDNQNEPAAASELSAPAIDEALYQDEFDFLFDDSNLDADDSSKSDVDLSVVLDELESELI